MATVQPTSIQTFRTNLAQFSPTSVMGKVANKVSPVVTQGRANGGIVFTDDRAHRANYRPIVVEYNSTTVNVLVAVRLTPI